MNTVIGLESFIKSCDKEINNICAATCKIYSNPRIEFDDLKSEAILKILEVWDKGTDIGLITSGKGLFVVVKNHLINYVGKFNRDVISKADSLDREFNTTTD